RAPRGARTPPRAPPWVPPRPVRDGGGGALPADPSVHVHSADRDRLFTRLHGRADPPRWADLEAAAPTLPAAPGEGQPAPVARSRRLALDPVDDLGVSGEPRPGPGSRVADDLLEDPDARAIADDVGMHGELEDPA